MEDFKHSTFKVRGMTCRSCVERIEDVRVDGIKDVSANLSKDSVSVSYRDEKSLEEFKKTIADMGFFADGVDKGGNGGKSGVRQGLMYGLIPHLGCIGFIVASVLGATVLMNLFRPLLMNRNIFFYLIGISVLFAALSSVLYLKRNGQLHLDGIRKRWGYLTTMFGMTVGINALLFFLIFPLAATAGGSNFETTDSSKVFIIDVNIPCPGHAPLITNELKTVDGVQGVEYSFPARFTVTYDSDLVSVDEIVSIEVFGQYPATVLGVPEGDQSANPTFLGSGESESYDKIGACGNTGCNGGCGGFVSSCSGACGGCGS